LLEKTPDGAWPPGEVVEGTPKKAAKAEGGSAPQAKAARPVLVCSDSVAELLRLKE